MDTPEAALVARGRPPREHLPDAGDVDADLVVTGRLRHGSEVIGPRRANSSRQAGWPDRYALSQFTIEGPTPTVTCPQGRTNPSWVPSAQRWGAEVLNVESSRGEGRARPARQPGTQAEPGTPRVLTFRHQADHQLLQAARQQQATEGWHRRSRRRAGIEGTRSQAVRAFAVRHTR